VTELRKETLWFEKSMSAYLNC